MRCLRPRALPAIRSAVYTPPLWLGCARRALVGREVQLTGPPSEPARGPQTAPHSPSDPPPRREGEGVNGWQDEEAVYRTGLDHAGTYARGKFFLCKQGGGGGWVFFFKAGMGAVNCLGAILEVYPPPPVRQAPEMMQTNAEASAQSRGIRPGPPLAPRSSPILPTTCSGVQPPAACLHLCTRRVSWMGSGHPSLYSLDWLQKTSWGGEVCNISGY